MAGFPNGHFYSPVIDAEDLRRREEELYGSPPEEPPGVDLNLEGQRALLEELREFANDFEYPQGSRGAPVESHQFHDGNGLFDGLDARMLFCMLRRLSPQRMIEVGSGHSSLLSADVNRRFLDGSVDITCIEPYPQPFLEEGIPGIGRVIEERVEAVGMEPFAELESGDLLFIDSSHVSKTGSDVNFLYLEVIPRLAEGVYIHIHDIFIPEEYPAEWVLGLERSWNEQYLLHAMLMFSRGLEVVFGSNCATCFFPELVRSVFSGSFGGGSFWMRKIVP